jgi:putative transposase
LVVDTLGLVLALVVHPADFQDRPGAWLAFARMWQRFPRLVRIWADGAYAGTLVAAVSTTFGWVLAIVTRATPAVGFVVEPHRWIVERTFAWLGRYRRLSKDYEALGESSEAWIYTAMINLMLHRLAPG